MSRNQHAIPNIQVNVSPTFIFAEGQIDVFTHEDTLGQCFNFDFGSNNIASEGMITLYHDGKYC